MVKTRLVPPDANFAMVNCEVGTISNPVSNPDNSWTFDTTDITTTQVRNVLGETTNNVSALCNSSKINPWALFKPIYGNGYSIGDFAGYNHNAKPPTYFFNPLTYYSSVKNAAGVGVIGFSLTKGERPPRLDNPSNDWSRLKVKITYGDAGGSKKVWSAMAPVGGTFQVSMSDGTDPHTYTGCTAVAYYCDANGNVLDEIEGGAHPVFTMKLDVIYYPYSITKGNECRVRHYYPYYDGGNKYDCFTDVPVGQSNSLGFDITTNPTKAIGLNFTEYSKVNSAGQTCPYGFSIMQGGSGKYYSFNITTATQRQLGTKFKELSTWYEVTSVYANGAKEYLTSFTQTTGFM